MTSFDALESSEQSSEPIELYEFVISNTPYRYTTSEDLITLEPGSVDWTPIVLERNQIVQGIDERKRVLRLRMSADNPFAALFKGVPPGRKATLTITRLQRNESPAFDTRPTIYKGVVQAVKFEKDGTEAIVGVLSLEAALGQEVPRVTYMGMCNHALYDAGCGVDPTLFSFVGAAASIDGREITITGAGASGFDFTGGYIQTLAGDDFRLVLRQVGDVVTVMVPFAEDPTGGTLQLFAGCDHLISGDCALTFDNVIEFGGYAWVPQANPFQDGVDA